MNKLILETIKPIKPIWDEKSTKIINKPYFVERVIKIEGDKKMKKVQELRELALINRKERGIFENYSDFEINKLTERQINDMFKTEEKYKNYKRSI